MNNIDYREVFQRKLQDQNSIKELEYHVNGDLVHLDKISIGCKACFIKNKFAANVGTQCNLKCAMCYYHSVTNDLLKFYDNLSNENLNNLFKLSLDENYKPEVASFSTWGESLLYLKEFKIYSDIFKKIEEKHCYSIYKHIYTNGVLLNNNNLNLLKEMNVNEIRVHISASNFSQEVYDNMNNAKSKGFILTIEEPSWPPHKEKILKELSTFNQLNVSHVNLIETQLTDLNCVSIEKEYPSALIYKDALHHVYDEGLVYDVFREKIKQNYTFSVLDCNSSIEKYRHYKSNYFQENNIEDAIKKWN